MESPILWISLDSNFGHKNTKFIDKLDSIHTALISLVVSSSIVSLSSTSSVSGNAKTKRPAIIEQIPQIVVGMNQINDPRPSTMYGAEMEPIWAIVELVPIAELLTVVGNNSAVCKITTTNTALMHIRPNNATPITASVCSNCVEKKNVKSTYKTHIICTYAEVSKVRIKEHTRLIRIELETLFFYPSIWTLYRVQCNLELL